MNEDTNVQDKDLEGKPEPELHTETKPAEETSERTREQFEKLTETNRKIAEKLKAYEAREKVDSVLDSLKPKAQQPQAPSAFDFGQFPVFDPNQKKMVDDSGYIDTEVMQSSISEAKERADRAEREARAIKEQFVKYEETQQTRMAHKEYPELNPNNLDKFDPIFYKLVRNELIGQIASGRKDVLAAAESVREYYQPKVEKEPMTNVTQEDQSSEKQVINSGQKKTTKSEYDKLDDKELIMQTRRGVKGSLAERLRRSGY